MMQTAEETAALIDESRRLLSGILQKTSEDAETEDFCNETQQLRRKSYWKLIKAKRQLGNFCSRLQGKESNGRHTEHVAAVGPRKLLPQSPEANFAVWLSASKNRWDTMRARNREGLVGLSLNAEASFPNADSPWISKSPHAAKVETHHNKANEVVPQKHRLSLAELIYTDRMDMKGFAAVASALSYLHPNDVSLTLQGYENVDQWSNVSVTANPSFSYFDNPMPGWRKDILIRMGGKSQGSLDVVFCPPEGGRRLRTKMELQAYVARFSLSASMVHRFDYRTVYCVCHQPESKESYIECSFGRAGCNGWLHSQCVGLGKLGEMDLRAMETVVCPLCATYLRAIGADEFLENKR
jgi:hypothetical protein